MYKRQVVDVARGVGGHDATVADHDQVVGHRQRLGLVVGDQHGGGTDTPQQVMDLLAQLDAQLGVEGRERFVEQDQLGLGGERPGQRHPLLLTTGQLVWLAVAQPGQADEVEQLVDPIATGRAGRAGQPEGDVAGDAEVREQRTFLGDDADAPGVGPHGGGRRRVERTTCLLYTSGYISVYS